VVEALDELVRGADVVKIVVVALRDDDLGKVLRDVALEFVGGGVTDLDRETVGGLFSALESRLDQKAAQRTQHTVFLS
jgi:hypothetical protein